MATTIDYCQTSSLSATTDVTTETVVVAVAMLLTYDNNSGLIMLHHSTNEPTYKKPMTRMTILTAGSRTATLYQQRQPLSSQRDWPSEKRKIQATGGVLVRASLRSATDSDTKVLLLVLFLAPSTQVAILVLLRSFMFIRSLHH